MQHCKSHRLLLGAVAAVRSLQFSASLRDHLLAVSERFDAGGFEALRPAWEARWRHRGRPVMARPPGAAAVEGLALGVDAQGALLLDTGTGAPVRVTAGDVEAL